MQDFRGPTHAATATSSRSLTERSIAAIKWNYLGIAARIAVQLVVQIALARLLGPDTFGLFAFVLLIVAVGGIIGEMGLGAALVQAREITERDIGFVFTRLMVAGFCVATIAFVSAPVAAAFLGDPRITEVIRVMTPVFIFQALAITPAALLRRELAFKAIQGVQIGSYAFGFLIVGVGLALLGAGVWSLVAAWITQTGSAAVALYLLRPHSLRPTAPAPDATLGRFGVRVLSTNVANWIVENIDNLLVGKLFGSTALGLYSVSYNLVRAPANHLVVALQMVLFPASARAQDNQAGLQRAYLTVISGVALIAFPAFVGIAAITDTVVTALFGVKWAQAAPLLTALSLAMALHAPMAVAGPVLWGKGAAGTEFRVQSCTALILIAALLIAARFSVTAMAWAVCGVYALRLIAMTVALMRHIRISLARLLHSVRGGVIASLLTTGILVASDSQTGAMAAGSRLIVDALLAASGFALFVFAVPGVALSNELADLAQRLLSPVSGLRRWLERVRLTHPAVCKPELS